MFAQEKDRINRIKEAVPEVVHRGLVWRRTETIEWVLFSAFIAGLAWVPYWYGSNEPIAWGINAVLFPGLAVIYEFFVMVRGEGHSVGLKEIKIPAALFLSVLFWILVQNATWTPSFLHHPIWAMTADALGKPVQGSISINRDLTTLALVRLITAASVFWIALQLCRNGSRSIQFIWAIAIIAGAYSAFGLASFVTAQSVITSSRNFVTSTFYNHNHFATFAGIGLIAACGLILRIYQNEITRAGGSLQFNIALLVEASQKASALFGLAFLIFVAVLLTGSRGGIVATGLGLAVLGVLTGVGRVQRFSAVVALGVIAITAGVFAFGDTFGIMIGQKGLYDDNRLAVHTITLRSIFDAPVLGYGYGTFTDVFPMIRDRSISVGDVWEQAHNTYLEVFQGLGVVFGSMLGISVILIAWRCLVGAFVRRKVGMVSSVATSAALLVGAHALVDFSLQIQAVTVTFMAVLGAGVAQSESSRLALND